jgi:glycosyltransferase involved in cell wall biosynthesis
MPVRNGARFLPAALASLAAQTFADFEILAVDDGSTDGTPAILRDWSRREPRLRVLTHPRNLGEAAARNRGLDTIRSPLVALLDADDLSLPGRLAAQVAFLEARPDIGLLGTNCEVIDSDGRHIEVIDSPADDEVVRWRSLINYAFIHSSLMFRRELVSGPAAVRYSAEHAVATDYDWFTRMLAVTRVATLQERLVRYRSHGASNTQVFRADQPAALAALARRAIARELPDFRPLALAEISALQAAYAGVRAPGRRVPLADMRAAAELYAELHEAFQAHARRLK